MGDKNILFSVHANRYANTSRFSHEDFFKVDFQYIGGILAGPQKASFQNLLDMQPTFRTAKQFNVSNQKNLCKMLS